MICDFNNSRIAATMHMKQITPDGLLSRLKWSVATCMSPFTHPSAAVFLGRSSWPSVGWAWPSAMGWRSCSCLHLPMQSEWGQRVREWEKGKSKRNECVRERESWMNAHTHIHKLRGERAKIVQTFEETLDSAHLLDHLGELAVLGEEFLDLPRWSPRSSRHSLGSARLLLEQLGSIGMIQLCRERNKRLLSGNHTLS